jgi:transposase/predicted GIY-YIG superfamily endonuclease
MQKEHCIYVIQNNINLKIYVGYSSRAKGRWADHQRVARQPKHPEHNKPLYYDIREYGIQNFSFYIIKKFDTEKEALRAEIDCIEALRTNITKYGEKCNGYNIHSGGGNPPEKRRALQPEQEEQVCKMYLAGKSCPEIAKEIHSKTHVIENALHAHNISMRIGAPIKTLSSSDELNVCKMYIDGMHSTEIATIYNVVYQVILKTLREHNIPIRSRQDRKGNRSIFSDQQEIDICNKYGEAGAMAKYLATEYKCDLSTIYDCLKRHNIPTKRKHKTYMENNE